MSANYEERGLDVREREPGEWGECTHESKLMLLTYCFDKHPHLLMPVLAMLLKVEPELVDEVYDKALDLGVDAFHYWRVV